MGRFPGGSNMNAGAVFNPPFEPGFLLDSWLNANACLTGVTAEVESGFFGVVNCGMALLVEGTFSESRICDADSLLFLDGDGVTGVLGGKNRGGAETRGLTNGFLGVTALGLKTCGGNALSKIAGRIWGRLGVVEVKPSGPNSRGRLDEG